MVQHISPLQYPDVSIEALYGYPPLLHIPYFSHDSMIIEVDTMLKVREATIQILKRNLHKAQHRM